ncbi:DUF2336 domain-containing protein [Hwanghaeella sp.]|uniref:DUF2336 domain-containing protein n=1 Tax=Hwanghaeella sp. TaxID=2605943 RepID=UPI003CCBF230
MTPPSLSDFYNTGGKTAVERDATYERAKTIAEKGSAQERAALAQEDDVPAEVLFFLANDKSKDVRRAVSGNDSAPIQADLVLAKDEDDDIRGGIADKMGRILPRISGEQNQKIVDMAFQVAGVLAQDRLPTVRALIAQQVKALDNVPKDIVMTLARDTEAMVSVPVLEFSPLLSETDLIDLISTGVNGEALAAVARRENLTASVSQAIVATEDDLAVPALLANRTAEIGQQAMEAIVEAGENHPGWHQPLVERGGLANELVIRIASYASERLVEKLLSEHDEIDAETKDRLRRSVKDRMQDLKMAWDKSDPEVARAHIFHRDGKLTPDLMAQAAARGEETFVLSALSLMTGVHDTIVRRALQGAEANKAAVTLAWKAGLGVKFASILQTELLRLPKSDVLAPGPSGKFPLEELEMRKLLMVMR